MIKFIAILLAVVSSSTIFYHQSDEKNNLCLQAAFDVSECPDLKAALDEGGFVAGACPGIAQISCSHSQEEELKALELLYKLSLGAACNFNFHAVDFEYKCVGPVETYHVVETGVPCGVVEFDAKKCLGLKDFLTHGKNEFLSGSCPKLFTKSNCGETELEAHETEIAESKRALEAFCSADIDFTLNILCEPRMKTFHKIDASNGLCMYVDFDRFECNDLPNVVENEDGFVPGPCPSGHTRDNCDSTTRLELDAVAALGKVIYSGYCDFDFDDVTYDYFCEEGSSTPTCPKECADAIASADKDAEFCSTIQNDLENGKKHDFPAACSDLGDMTVGLCMTELYEKCIEGSDKYICPIPEYGLPPVLKNCEPQNCAEWKEAVDTGCAKDASACLKDEMQGKLGCTKQGKKLPVSSYASCNKSEACPKSGEFCYFGDDLETGECQLCSFNLCEYLTNDKAKAECLEQCTNQDCTADLGCDDTCDREPKTCKQLEDAVESVSACGKACNQCYIDVYNAKLECKGGDKVQSRLDGDSASALSILMLATVAIFLWV
jgi:hypothetical protein